MAPESLSGQRILVIGPRGAGKSYASRIIGARLGLPVVHLDAEYWQPGWREPERAAWQHRIEELVAQPRWVIDGSHAQSLEVRLRCADTVICLDLPIRLCLWRIFKRLSSNFGRVRPDMGAGCPERIDLEFLWYVLRWNSVQRPKLAAQLAPFTGCTIVLETRRQLDEFLCSLRLPPSNATTASEEM